MTAGDVDELRVAARGPDREGMTNRPDGEAEEPEAEAKADRPGKRADLVLLNGNPLADIRQTMQPAGVMIGGRWLSRQEIDRRLESLTGKM